MRAFKIVPLVTVKSANISKKALKRLEWFDFWHTHGENISLTCRHFGISRDTFYLWKERFNPYNLKTLEVKSTRPHRVRSMTISRSIIDLVVKIRSEDLEKSKYEVQAELKDKYGVRIGYNTIQKIINRNPKLLNTQYRKRLKAHRRLKIARIKAAYEFFNYQDDLLNDDLDEINRRCDIFNQKYNQKRYHQALHYQTPYVYVTNYVQ